MKDDKRMVRIVLMIAMLLALLSGCGSTVDMDKTPDEDLSIREEEPENLPAYQKKLDVIEPEAYSEVTELELEPGTYISVVGKRETSAFWEEVAKGVEAAGEALNTELGYKGKDAVKVSFNGPPKGESVGDQVNLLDEELALYPAALAIAIVDRQACDVQFDLAAENGIPIVAFDSGSDHDGIMAKVATDNSRAAAECATQMSQLIGEQEEIIIIAHDSGSETAAVRVTAFTDALEEQGFQGKVAGIYQMDAVKTLVADAVNVGTYVIGEGFVGDVPSPEVFENGADMSSDNSDNKEDTGAKNEGAESVSDGKDKQETSAAEIRGNGTPILQEEHIDAKDVSEEEAYDFLYALHPQMKGAYATNADTLDGVIAANERNGRTDLKVIGYDLDETIRRALEDKKISGTIVQNPFGMGYASVIAAARAALDMGNEAFVNTGFVWVTPENLQDEQVQAFVY